MYVSFCFGGHIPKSEFGRSQFINRFQFVGSVVELIGLFELEAQKSHMLHTHAHTSWLAIFF